MIMNGDVFNVTSYYHAKYYVYDSWESLSKSANSTEGYTSIQTTNEAFVPMEMSINSYHDHLCH